MGADVYATSEAAKRVFHAFDDALGFSLSDLCFQGPEETLRSTINAQPAIVAVSLAYLAAFQETLSSTHSSWSSPLTPAYTAGHSVGECAALVPAGVLDLKDAAYLVRERGRLMHEEETACPGGMAAVIGMDSETLQTICQEATQQCSAELKDGASRHVGEGKVIVANYNAPGQIVISGEQRALAAASALASARGAKKVIPLAVSGAFHSPVMEPATGKLAQSIARTNLRDARIPVISNITARPLTAADELRDELAQQVASSVQWIRTIEYLRSAGVTIFFEIGPGKALAGMIKRIVKDATILNIGSVADIGKAVAFVQDARLLS